MTAIGRYRIGARLGRGGSADVFAAELVDGGGRPLALKRLRRELVGAVEIAALFDGEVALARRLHHGGIVQVYDHGVDADGAPYLVMERVDGVALDELLAHLAANGQRLTAADAVMIAIAACDALGYAHRLCGDDDAPLGVVHRDVSPRNLLVSREGLIKLTDFGIARFARDGAHTLPGVVKGSIGYLAPEQLAGAPLDGSADQFALGVVLREMLTGSNPLGAAHSLEDAAARLAEGLPPLPLDEITGADATLAAMIARATAARPGDRYPSVDALGDALAAWSAATDRRGDRARLAALVRAARGERPALVRSLDAALGDALTAPPPSGATVRAAVAPPRRRGPRWLVALAVVAVTASVTAWQLARGTRALATTAPHDPASALDAAARADAAPAPDAGPPVDAPLLADAASPTPRVPRDGHGKDPSADATGRLKINLMPYAQVTVDGRRRGDTPLDLELGAGPHRLELFNPQSGRRTTRSVVVPASGVAEVTRW